MRAILLLFLLSGFFIANPHSIFSQDTKKKMVVVIDAGHGGKDPGAVGRSSLEKEITLSIALKTGAYIERNMKDVKVIYTRKTDRFIPLHQRAKIANENKADFFISIHCNANNSSKIYGTETYVMGLHKSQANLEVAKLENASILKEDDYSSHYEGFNPNSAEAYIIFSLYQNAFLDESLNLAAKVQKQFKDRVGLRDRGVYQAGFWVLYKTTMPGILVEAGYLSNTKDEKFLKTKDGQTYIASAIYRALKEYKEEIDRNKKVLSRGNIETASKMKITEDVVFRVQILSSPKKLNINRKFKGLNDIYSYKHNGEIKYCSGKTSTFKSANNLKKTIRKGKYKDAFVVAFLDGKRISIEKAQSLVKN